MAELVLRSNKRESFRKRKDSFRRPLEVLEFAGLASGELVLDVGSGFGYWAEIASSITGKVVDCQNATEWRSFFLHIDFDKQVKRLLKQRKKFNFFWSSFNEPANGAENKYDLAISYTNYHDLFDMDVNRQEFLTSIKNSLKKDNGRFLLIDHRAEVGSGSRDAGSNRGLHRIDEILVREEIKLAGFEIERESSILSKESDDLGTQAWTSPMHDTDRFCLLLKPLA